MAKTHAYLTWHGKDCGKLFWYSMKYCTVKDGISWPPVAYINSLLVDVLT